MHRGATNGLLEPRWGFAGELWVGEEGSGRDSGGEVTRGEKGME